MLQIDQFKEEITGKDHALVQEHFSHHNVEKEKDAIKLELSRVKRQIQSSKQIIEAQAVESKKLTAVIAEAELERERQRKEFASVLSERDVLRTQVRRCRDARCRLVAAPCPRAHVSCPLFCCSVYCCSFLVQLMKRDAELAALYEKLKMQRSMLDKGGSTFATQKKAESDLKATVAELRSELHIAKLQVCGNDGLPLTLSVCTTLPPPLPSYFPFFIASCLRVSGFQCRRSQVRNRAVGA